MAHTFLIKACVRVILFSQTTLGAKYVIYCCGLEILSYTTVRQTLAENHHHQQRKYQTNEKL